MIITLALSAHIDDTKKRDLVLSIVIVICNICGGLIYKLLHQDPNTKFKYDIQGFIIVIMVALALCCEWDSCITLLLVIVSSYIDFDLTMWRDIFSKTKREILAHIVHSALIIAIVFCITESVERWGKVDAAGFILPILFATALLIYYLYHSKKRNCPSPKHSMEARHQHLLNVTKDYLQRMDEIEGLLLIGSRASGSYDIYSDVDLMAGCFDGTTMDGVSKSLCEFFEKRKDCYVKERKWSQNVLGLSVYYKDGSSMDISFMPTAELVIRAPYFKTLISKTENFEKTVSAKHEAFSNELMRYGVDNSIHYQFMYELRNVEIALLREQFIFADIALGNARKLVLSVETVAEGKKLHQFKEYNTLSRVFLNRLDETYPQSRNYESMYIAKEKLLTLYLETVNSCDYLTYDNNLSILVGRNDLPRRNRQ